MLNFRWQEWRWREPVVVHVRRRVANVTCEHVGFVDQDHGSIFLTTNTGNPNEQVRQTLRQQSRPVTVGGVAPASGYLLRASKSFGTSLPLRRAPAGNQVVYAHEIIQFWQDHYPFLHQ